MIWLIIIILALVTGVTLYIQLNPQFGSSLSDANKNSYQQSKYWEDGKFMNQSVTTMDIGIKSMPGLLKAQFTNTAVRSPEKPIPVVAFDEQKFNTSPEKPKFIWYGHSVLLLQIEGKNYLIDPMFGNDASPIGPFTVKRFSENTLEIIDQLPPIEAVLFTHDHYDHLDYASIKKLKSKVSQYYVALGLGRHLEKWGVPAEQIKELDWWDEINTADLRIVFTPSRHFSGRGLFDRAKSLWGGFVFQSKNHRIYWSGDGGYDTHYKEIGEKLGPFDWAFVECGQYNKLWHQIHNYPEEAVQAGIDSQSKVSIPVHWGGFNLALHPWKEPAERFIAHAKDTQTTISVPQIGEIVVMGAEPQENNWFEKME